MSVKSSLELVLYLLFSHLTLNKTDLILKKHTFLKKIRRVCFLSNLNELETIKKRLFHSFIQRYTINVLCLPFERRETYCFSLIFFLLHVLSEACPDHNFFVFPDRSMIFGMWMHDLKVVCRVP
jgi:hypothetical protein